MRTRIPPKTAKPLKADNSRKLALEALDSDYYVKNATLDFIAAYQLKHGRGPSITAIDKARLAELPRVSKLLRESINEEWVYEVSEYGIRYETNIFL
jgi:hypothetical protein